MLNMNNVIINSGWIVIMCPSCIVGECQFVKIAYPEMILKNGFTGKVKSARYECDICKEQHYVEYETHMYKQRQIDSLPID